MDKRLEKIYEYIPENKVVADIGTDHGQLALALIERKKAKRVVATDISAPSLGKLRSALKDHPKKHLVKTVVTDGFHGLEDEGIQVAVLAGMGGVLISRILEENNLPQLETLVLSPNVGAEELRPALAKMGYRIEREDFIHVEGIDYPVFIVRKGEDSYEGFGECFFGTWMPKHPNRDFCRYVEKERKYRERLLTKMKKVPTAGYRVRELEEELREIRKVEEQIHEATRDL